MGYGANAMKTWFYVGFCLIRSPGSNPWDFPSSQLSFANYLSDGGAKAYSRLNEASILFSCL